MAPKKGKQKMVHQVDLPAVQKTPFQLDADAEIPSPVVTFDIRDMSKIADNYDKCVKGIRDCMKKDTDITFTFIVDGKEVIVPVTPAQNWDNVEGIYTIEITDGILRLFLVADKYQNWFRGFVTNEGNRYEIDHDTLPNIMKNSQSLKTNGMYPYLLNCHLSELTLGCHQLISAFHTLARYGGDTKGLSRVKEAIAILLVMLFEGPRLLPLHEKMKSSLIQNLKAVVGIDMDLITNWCSLSKSFYEKNGYEKKVVISEKTPEDIKKAVKTFGILCRSKWDEWVGEQSAAKKQSRGHGSSSGSSKKH